MMAPRWLWEVTLDEVVVAETEVEAEAALVEPAATTVADDGIIETVDEGELALRQVALFDSNTCIRSVVPPDLP